MDRSFTSSSKPNTEPTLRLFCGKVLLFVLGAALLLFPLSLLSQRADRAALAAPDFHLGPGTTLVVAGDSHTETSLNPQLMPGMVNISLSAENYFYTFFKLKHFLDHNIQVRTVVLGYSPHNVMDHDSEFLADQGDHQKDYFILVDSQARRQLASFRLPYVVAQLNAEYGIPFRMLQDHALVKYLLGRRTFSREDLRFNGSFKGLKGSHLDVGKIAARTEKHFFENDRYAGFSRIMTAYLDKIAALCKDRHISLILVNMPVADEYRRRIPATATADTLGALSVLMRKYDNVSYCDLGDISLAPDKFFDGNHVNGDGAKVVTAIFMQRCQKIIAKDRN